MRRALQLVLILSLLLSARFASAGDPYLRWYTVETPHFRVHYHGGLEELAQRVATIAEYVDATLKPDLKWDPDEVTHVLLTDDSEGANGSANTVPYNTVRMYATAPDDMSVLNDTDDWALLLMTHEHTHVLHIDNVHGLPAVLNAIFGKRYAPNQEQPRWIIEGLATAMESRHTSAGRLRSSLFDMYLRADVLEDNMLSIDQLSHSMRRFPGVSLWYLYGSRFIDWILDTYGPDTFGAVSIDYGQNLIPWGINRSIRRATGATYPELYAGWKASLQRRYQAQRAAIEARGIREGRRLTHAGGSMGPPRFVPHCGQSVGDRARVLFFRRDLHTTAGFYRLDLDRPRQSEPTLVTRARGSVASYDAECGFVFESIAPSVRRYALSDLFRQAAGTRSPRGYESGRRRLTVGRRAGSPDVSPSGRRVVFVTNRAGTTTLRIADYHPVDGVSNIRLLVNKRRWEQVFTPRFSPDGKRVAFGTWLTGGYRDIHVVDVDTGRVTKLTHDRAIDQQPSWSPDGRTLYFSSDRTGVSNVYAYAMKTGELRQVTNVVNGAYMPEVSPDGSRLLYVGYTSEGFDLFSMPLDPERFLPALPYVDLRPEVVHVKDVSWPVRPYEVWPTLRPYSYAIDYGDGAFGKTVTVTAEGVDVTERHSLAAEVAVDLEEAIPQASLAYGFGGLPMDLSARVFRSVVPRSYTVGDRTPIIRESVTGMSSGLGYGIPGEFSSQFLAFSYSVNLFDQHLPVDGYVDPYAPVPSEPHRGQLGLLHVGYNFRSTDSSAYSISTEEGWTMDLGVDYASKYTVSDDSLYSVEGRIRGYFLLPWLRHHVLAMSLRGGSAGGTYPRRGFFYTGGFSDEPVLDAYTSNLLQSAFVLRGYEPSQFGGNQFFLSNAEYRFPISFVERGLSTLPVFVGAVSGVVFADFGGAFNRLNYEKPESDLHLGTGAELWVDLTLGYSVENTLRFGVARGFGPPAPGLMKYFVAAARF